jgi:hypothetical protein
VKQGIPLGKAAWTGLGPWGLVLGAMVQGTFGAIDMIDQNNKRRETVKAFIKHLNLSLPPVEQLDDDEIDDEIDNWLVEMEKYEKKLKKGE